MAFPSPIAIEWVMDQILCKGLLVGLAEGLPALCIGLLPCSVWWVKQNSLRATCVSRTVAVCTYWTSVQMLSIFTQLRSKLDSEFFHNCEDTTVPYFFITLSIYVFITREIPGTFMLLYQLNTFISYTSIVLLHSSEE